MGYRAQLRTAGKCALWVAGPIGGVSAILGGYSWVVFEKAPTQASTNVIAANPAIFFAGLLGMVTAVCAYIAGAGYLATWPREGPRATLATASAGLLLSMVGRADIVEHLGGGAVMAIVTFTASLFDTFIVRIVASLALGLAIGALVEDRPSPTSRVMTLLRNPWILAAAIGATSFAVRRTVSLPTPEDVAKDSLARRSECVDVDDMHRRCGPVEAVAMDASGVVVAEVHPLKAHEDGIGLWNLGSARRTWERFVAPSNSAPGAIQVVVSADGRRIAFRGPKRIILMDAASGEPIRIIATCGETFDQRFVAFTPDANSLAVSGGEGVCIQSVATGEVEKTLAPGAGPDGAHIGPMAIARDGTLWLERAGNLERWDIATATKRLTIAGQLFSFALSPDGHRIVGLRSDRGEMTAWDADDGTLLARRDLRSSFKRDGAGISGQFVVLSDNRHVLAESIKGFRILDPWTDEYRLVPHGESLASTVVATSANGSIVALAGTGVDTLSPTLLTLSSETLLGTDTR